MNTAKCKALFLDRDGTILKEIKGTDPDSPSYKGYLTGIEEVELISGTADAIAKARELGFKIIVVTNQSAIARGWLTHDELSGINGRMNELLLAENNNAVIDELYYSPYHSEGVIEEYKTESPMRKPGIGMILLAVDKYNISLKSSYMIGDAFSDMMTGENAGMKKILVMTGYGKIAYKKCLDEKIKIDFIADNLRDAVGFIEKYSEK